MTGRISCSSRRSTTPAIWLKPLPAIVHYPCFRESEAEEASRALELGLMNDAAALRQAILQCEHPVSFAFLLPFKRDAEQSSRLRRSIDQAFLSPLREVEPGTRKHLALVEVVRRAYKRWAMEVDRSDKESRSRNR